jgi:predicted PhzF superfamily epimerase YddE/YHI9
MTRIFLVDAFTDSPFSGNPAAVCPLHGEWEDVRMQKLAAELHAPETAFFYPQGDHYILRWFSPRMEVELCGHATLAAAHVIWEQGVAPLNRLLRFFSRSGLLSAWKENEWITLDFPAEPSVVADPPPGLAEALGAVPAWVGKNRFDYLGVFESADEVKSLRPDFSRLARIPARGVIVTAPGTGQGQDFVSRFFAPALGIDEDQVTGSAHCALGPYWSSRLHKDVLVGFQASERGGTVRVSVLGERVAIAGQAVTVMCGDLCM